MLGLPDGTRECLFDLDVVTDCGDRLGHADALHANGADVVVAADLAELLDEQLLEEPA